MHKEDFKKISRFRAREAKILYEHGRFDGAYYLLGYAIECSLKSCIASQIKNDTIPDKKLINNFYTHDLENLLGLSGLKQKFETDCKANNDLKINWAIAINWSEKIRYNHSISWRETKDFFGAVQDQQSGVLTWIMKFW